MNSWLRAVVPILCIAPSASADMPTLDELALQFGLSQRQIEQVRDGEIVRGTASASHDRELVATMVFLVRDVEPETLIAESKAGLLDQVDPQTLSFEIIQGEPGPPSFERLTLEPDRERRVRAYRSARPGTDLNLSNDEIADFQGLGGDAETPEVEAEVRGALLDRLEAYRARGLDGIAPYARRRGTERHVGADLRKATKTYTLIEERLPHAHRHLLGYPEAPPEGTEGVFRWSQIDAQGTPTLVLTHSLYIPEGPAWLILLRQFYVSTGYNSTQAGVVFLPVPLGTAVFYVNRTSTDQVEGVGGGARRAIGNRLLALQLEALFDKVRARAEQGG